MAGRLLTDPTTLAGVILCTIVVVGAVSAGGGYVLGTLLPHLFGY